MRCSNLAQLLSKFFQIRHLFRFIQMATLQDFSQQEEFSVLRLEATAYATATVSNHALLLQLRLSLKLSDKCSQVFPIFAFIIFQPGIRLYQ